MLILAQVDRVLVLEYVYGGAEEVLHVCLIVVSHIFTGHYLSCNAVQIASCYDLIMRFASYCLTALSARSSVATGREHDLLNLFRGSGHLVICHSLLVAYHLNCLFNLSWTTAAATFLVNDLHLSERSWLRRQAWLV